MVSQSNELKILHVKKYTEEVGVRTREDGTMAKNISNLFFKNV